MGLHVEVGLHGPDLQIVYAPCVGGYNTELYVTFFFLSVTHHRLNFTRKFRWMSRLD